jgi:diguanylate cyclase (GGDEF)-like protein
MGDFHGQPVCITMLREVGRAPRVVVGAAGLAAVVAIWWADRLTPDDFRFGFIYILPVCAVAWWGPPRAAVACAALAALGLVTNDLTVRPGAAPIAIAWNEFTRIVTMFAIAFLIIYVRAFSERARNYSAETFRLAITDPLTGLYNRRYLDDQLVRIHATAARSGRPYALLAMDVDEFKLVNDTYGHSKGDAALVVFADDLRSVVRAGDIAVRTGGDEFVVVLPEATASDAEALAHRVERALTRRAKPQEIRRVSAGVVEWRPHVGPEDLLAEADQLVYQSKRVGGGTISRPATA